MLPPLYVVSDSRMTDNIADCLTACLDNGAPWIGIREYNMNDTTLGALIETTLKTAESTGAMVSVWGHVGMAETFGIGLHQSHKAYDLSLKSCLDWDSPLGASTHTPDEITRVRGADYITLSPVFDSISKSGYTGMGLHTFTDICAYAPMPVFALGGITVDTAQQVLECGAYGVALCGQAMHSPKTVADILKVLD